MGMVQMDFYPGFILPFLNVIITTSKTYVTYKNHCLHFTKSKSSCRILRLSTLNVTTIILTAVILDFSTLSSTNLQIVTPKNFN